MHDNVMDVVERLLSIRRALGDSAFRQACHRARLSMATVAMEHAERAAERLSKTTPPSEPTKPSVNSERR